MAVNKLSVDYAIKQIAKLEQMIEKEESIVKSHQNKIADLGEEIKKWSSIKKTLEKLNEDINSLEITKS